MSKDWVFPLLPDTIIFNVPPSSDEIGSTFTFTRYPAAAKSQVLSTKNPFNSSVNFASHGSYLPNSIYVVVGKRLQKSLKNLNFW